MLHAFDEELLDGCLNIVLRLPVEIRASQEGHAVHGLIFPFSLSSCLMFPMRVMRLPVKKFYPICNDTISFEIQNPVDSQAAQPVSISVRARSSELILSERMHADGIIAPMEVD